MQPININHDTDITTEDELKQSGIGAESDMQRLWLRLKKLVLSF